MLLTKIAPITAVGFLLPTNFIVRSSSGLTISLYTVGSSKPTKSPMRTKIQGLGIFYLLVRLCWAGIEKCPPLRGLFFKPKQPV